MGFRHSQCLEMSPQVFHRGISFGGKALNHTLYQIIKGKRVAKSLGTCAFGGEWVSDMWGDGWGLDSLRGCPHLHALLLRKGASQGPEATVCGKLCKSFLP